VGLWLPKISQVGEEGEEGSVFDCVTQLVSAVVHLLNQPQKLNAETTFTLLMSVGKIIMYNRDLVGELISALELNLNPFLTPTQPTKVVKVAKEIQVLLQHK